MSIGYIHRIHPLDMQNNMFDVKVVLDSINENGERITTMQLTYPRFIHAEVLTHRDRARNSGSNRAIPWIVVCEQIDTDPVVPIFWAKEGKGMTTIAELGDDPIDTVIAQRNTGYPINTRGELLDICKKTWLKARDSAMYYAEQLHALGVHKSLCNRLVEPFQWITTVMTATQWKHFLLLRNHPDAEKHFQQLASKIEEKINESIPRICTNGYWHQPFIDTDDRIYVRDNWEGYRDYVVGEIPSIIEMMGYISEEIQLDSATIMNNKEMWCNEIINMASIARCARVSVVPHGSDGSLQLKKSILSDLKTFRRLFNGSSLHGVRDGKLEKLPHISPFEHVAYAFPGRRSGPFQGWLQYRKRFNDEYND